MTDHSSGTVKVWDPLVRLFHWGLVASFTVTWLTGDEWDDVHEIAGYVIAGLIVFRLVWGGVGTRYARFSEFVRGPQVVIRYMKDAVRGRERRYLGHNPAGAAMIVVLLLTLAGACITGWLYTTDWFWGAELVEETHEWLANALLLLVALHVGGVVLESWHHRENLTRSMVTGLKRSEAGHDRT
ncbi:cytochrome b/b6 domain-containing protein [Marinobacter lacisalsi]|uniref:Cytochrome b/b6 domain-containing protein n=1 Tax=Marinobacter lacisalsi TaxID=475979 RepID=A0ABV8QK08_9GAMM